MMKDIETSEMKLGINKPGNNLLYWLSIGSIGLSLVLLLSKKNALANFVGLWAPTFLGLGVYLKENKILEYQKKERSLSA